VKGSKQAHVDPKIQLEGVTLVTPRGEAIVSNLNLTVPKGEAVMVTGRNATGKTSFVRSVSGLWPTPAGTITVPTPHGSRRPGLKEV
jgi:putative ATP-binding cassette transporter